MHIYRVYMLHEAADTTIADVCVISTTVWKATKNIGFSSVTRWQNLVDDVTPHNLCAIFLNCCRGLTHHFYGPQYCPVDAKTVFVALHRRLQSHRLYIHALCMIRKMIHLAYTIFMSHSRL